MATNLSRRFFLTGFGAVAGTFEACSTGPRRSGADRRVPSGPWKWDTVLWDRDGWTAAPLQKFHRVDDGRLVVRIRSRAEQGYANDLYHEQSETLALGSSDGGFTWRPYDGPLLDEKEVRLRDGTIIEV